MYSLLKHPLDMNNLIFEGLYPYLDACAQKSPTPLTDEQIVVLKKEYRKKYLAYKKKMYRAKHKTITLSMSEKEYTELTSKAKEYGISLRDYQRIKLFADLDTLNVSKAIFPLVLELIDLLEEAIYEQSMKHLPKTLNLLLTIKTSIV
jgi:hypothetical protein